MTPEEWFFQQTPEQQQHMALDSLDLVSGQWAESYVDAMPDTEGNPWAFALDVYDWLTTPAWTTPDRRT
ncbi:MAG: hypothetical protein VBE63_23930 [Lamprobacter sp.]|uniref:hypothetical protein n=1 Tax=Lamprobacter sp. TaxID=3100796 RepID=UPI002B2644FC|nr:hypothetical protein [Lamprobacter sp.]MEA3642965.1 hypothetical protein [Lamprobacter sp.]